MTRTQLLVERNKRRREVEMDIKMITLCGIVTIATIIGLFYPQKASGKEATGYQVDAIITSIQTVNDLHEVEYECFASEETDIYDGHKYFALLTPEEWNEESFYEGEPVEVWFDTNNTTNVEDDILINIHQKGEN